MKRIVSVGLLLVLLLGLCSMAGCEKKRLSEMEWEQCRKHLVRCGMEIPEGKEDYDLRPIIEWMEQYGFSPVVSYEEWPGLYAGLLKAVEEYYGQLPIASPETESQTE